MRTVPTHPPRPNSSRSPAPLVALALALLAPPTLAGDLEAEGLIRHLSQKDWRYDEFAVGAAAICQEGFISPALVAAGVTLQRCADDPKGARPGFDEDYDGVVWTWGCLLTSTAMIAQRWGMLPGLGAYIPLPRWNFTEVSPVHVHLALLKSDGYDDSQDIQVKYAGHPLKGAFSDASLTRMGLRLRLRWWPDAKEQLDAGLAIGRPFVLVVQPDPTKRITHAVVAVGMAGEEYLVLDPWEPTTIGHPQARLFSTLYGGKDWQKSIKAAIDFAPMGADGQSWMDFEMHSPVELLLVAPDGRRTGYDAARGLVVEEIPGSSYAVEGMAVRPFRGDAPKALLVDSPAAGTWSLTMVATGDGPFTLRVNGQDPSGFPLLHQVTGTVRRGEVRTFTILNAPGSETPMVIAEGSTIPPIAVAGPPRAVFAGAPVTFDGSRSRDLDGAIAAYAWDFGDGAAGAGARPTHAYSAPGVYTARLTVTDDGGATATGEARVDVYPAARPATPGDLTLASWSPDAAQFAVAADFPSLSGDGRVLAFTAPVPFGEPHVYLRDLAAGSTVLAGMGAYPTLSRSGRWVAYQRTPGQDFLSNGVFVYDRVTGVEAKADLAPDGTPADGRSWSPVLSGDGRHLLFISEAANLVPGFAGLGLYLRDLDSGEVHYVGEPYAPYGGDDLTRKLAVSEDGGVVAQLQRNGFFQGFYASIWTRATGATTIGPGVPTFDSLALSGDGRTAAIAGADTGGGSTILVMDLASGVTEPACVSSLGTPAEVTGECRAVRLSVDGRFVAFTATASNLVPGDLQGRDAFLRDRLHGTTELVSTDAAGTQLPDLGWGLRALGGVCDDGRCLALVFAAGGVPEDVNGLLDVYLRRLPGGEEPAPPLADAGGPYHGWAGRPVALAAARSSSATAAVLTATWTFGDGTAPVTAPAATPVDHVYAAAGTYAASVRVSDGTRTSVAAQARVEVLEAPVAGGGTLSLYPSCASPGDLVAVTLGRQRLGGASWDEAGEGPPGSALDAAPPSTLELGAAGSGGDLGTSALPVVRLARRAPLEYAVSADWTVPAGLAAGAWTLTAGGATATLQVPCPAPPAVATLPVSAPGGPYAGVAGAPVAFDGSGSTDPRALPLTYAWDFGDGETGSGARSTAAQVRSAVSDMRSSSAGVQARGVAWWATSTATGRPAL